MSGLNPFRRTVGFYEVMATSLPQPCEVSQVSSTPANDKYRQVPQSTTHRLQGNTSANNRVNFKLNREEEVEKKKKYFTAKYGQHQMLLIRKRLAVEDWVYEALRDLYDCQVSMASLFYCIDIINNDDVLYIIYILILK